MPAVRALAVVVLQALSRHSHVRCDLPALADSKSISVGDDLGKRPDSHLLGKSRHPPQPCAFASALRLSLLRQARAGPGSDARLCRWHRSEGPRGTVRLFLSICEAGARRISTCPPASQRLHLKPQTPGCAWPSVMSRRTFQEAALRHNFVNRCRSSELCAPAPRKPGLCLGSRKGKA